MNTPEPQNSLKQFDTDRREPVPSAFDHVDSMCLTTPWLVLITKEAKYSFMELWTFVMVWGFSAGPMLISAFMRSRAKDYMELLFAEYLAFHVHCAVFLAVIDTLHWRRGNPTENRYERLGYILLSQLLVGFIVYCGSLVLAK